MKMSSLLVERTLSQFEAQPLADDHPRVAQLNQLFGEHTFFLTAVACISLSRPSRRTLEPRRASW